MKVRPSSDGEHQPPFRPLRSFSSSAWCAQVTVVPEVSRISVLSSGRCQGSKVSMPLRRPHAADEGRCARVVHLVGKQRGVEIGPEPGDEEHHLRGDEQDHAVAVRDLHHAGVIVLDFGLARSRRATSRSWCRRCRCAPTPKMSGAAGDDVVHPHDQPDRGDEGRDGADGRPRARIRPGDSRGAVWRAASAIHSLRRSTRPHVRARPLTLPLEHDPEKWNRFSKDHAPLFILSPKREPLPASFRDRQMRPDFGGGLSAAACPERAPDRTYRTA